METEQQEKTTQSGAAERAKSMSASAGSEIESKAQEVMADFQDDSENERGALGRLEDIVEKPSVGATITGAVVLGVAATFGVIEAGLAAGAGYLVYRVLRTKKAQPPTEARR